MNDRHIGPVVDIRSPEAAAIKARKAKLMAARAQAVARKDWPAMNEITKRIAKLPALIVRSGS